MSHNSDRASRLTSRRQQTESIIKSRKRKLGELYTVAERGIPNSHAHALQTPRNRYLDDNDILKGKAFDLSVIPAPRRQLRSDSAKRVPSDVKKSTTPHKHVSDNTDDTLDHVTNAPQRKLPISSPHSTSKVNGENSLENGTDSLPKSYEKSSTPVQHDSSDALRRGRSARDSTEDTIHEVTKGAQSDVESGRTRHLETPVEKLQADVTSAVNILENEHIRNHVESQPGSPGVDPRKTEGSNDQTPQEHHKAVTVHLPPKEVQEQHMREVDRGLAREALREQREDAAAGPVSLSIEPPKTDAPRAADPVSSPGSTTAQSINTPAVHDTSADTSPDNESSQFNAEALDKAENGHTPTNAGDDINKTQDYDIVATKQAKGAQRGNLASSPIIEDVDAQVRAEIERAAAASGLDKQGERSRIAAPKEGTNAGSPNPTATTTVRDSMEDEEDEVIGVPTPEDAGALNPDISQPITELDTSDKMDIDPEKVINQPEPTSSDIATALDGNASQGQEQDADLSSETSRQTPSQTTGPTLERMTTRVSSGAMRHKSVSEILGEIPRPNTSPSERQSMSKTSESVTNSRSATRSSTPQSPRMRSLVERAKEKERSKLSTVVFAKQQHKVQSEALALLPNGGRPKENQIEDYMMTMFIRDATRATKSTPDLSQLLQSARKTLTTSNCYVPILESQACKVLERITHLQNHNRWSLRQPKRSIEPNRPTTHWDVMLKEMKWMRTDFREEKKWKMAVASNLAHACAEWIEADDNDRKLLQVNAKSPPIDAVVDATGDVEMVEEVPELTASINNDSPPDAYEEEPQVSFLDTVAPTAIFALPDEDVVFGLRRSPATDKLLQELPTYGAFLEVPSSQLPTSKISPDAHWRLPALPLSKYVQGKMEILDKGPPKKKSRYDYEDEDEEELVVFGSQGPHHPKLDPEQTDVALFNPENKHIRDRIHAGHQFRPPSEFPMPLQSFFEARHSSQWTWAEDDELKSLVREYSYNWSLIASILQSKSMFSSGAERRTPWECFERWIHLEGLPADMQKTQYFRAYNNRLEAAQRNVQAQAAQVPPPQPNAPPGQFVVAARRKTTTSVRVERRRNQKHLTLVDAMRKLAKKRETSVQKAQHAAQLAAMRSKANEAPTNRPTLHTPQYFSKVKHERDVQYQERVAQLQLRQEQARRAAMAQRAALQNPQQQQTRPGNTNGTNLPPGTPAPNQNQLAVPGQNRPHPPMQPLTNGMGAQGPIPSGYGGMPHMGIKGMPQAPMQGMPGQGRLPQPNPTPDLRMVQQNAQHIAEQQRRVASLQAMQHPPLLGGGGPQNSQIHNSPPNMRGNPNAIGQQFMQGNPALMQAFSSSNGNGNATPPANGTPAGSAASPRINHPGSVQPMANLTPQNQIRSIEENLRSRYPQLSAETIRKMAQEAYSKNLLQHRQQLSQSAMHAAAGVANNPGAPPPPGGGGPPNTGNSNGLNPASAANMAGSGMSNSPQMYAQMLRAQQERQQQAAARGNSATPAPATGPGPVQNPHGQAPQASAQRPQTPQTQTQGQSQAQAQSQPRPPSQSQSQPQSQPPPPQQGQPQTQPRPQQVLQTPVQNQSQSEGQSQNGGQMQGQQASK